MGVETYATVILTCGRCGQQEEIEDHDADRCETAAEDAIQGGDWKRVENLDCPGDKTPRSLEDESLNDVDDVLCPECVTTIETLMKAAACAAEDLER